MLKFSLYCDTQFGQNLFVVVDGKHHAMNYEINALWSLTIEHTGLRVAQYEYYIKNADNTVVYDAQRYRFIPRHSGNLSINDRFEYTSLATVFDTKPFISTWMRQPKEQPLPKMTNGDVVLAVHAPGVRPNEDVVLVGDDEALGGWRPERGIVLTPSANAVWWTRLPNDTSLTHKEYKFFVRRKHSPSDFFWETCGNRRLPIISAGKLITTTISIDYDFRIAGVAVPVFSIRSRNSWGVGDFFDLKLMCDWAAKRGQKIIQILPINDTTSTGTDLDSYPYRANSIYALHPMYINVEALGALKNRRLMKELRQRAAELNELPEMDYSAVNRLKMEYLHARYEELCDSLATDKGYAKYVRENGGWVVNYAVFSYLRETCHTDDWTKWEDYAEFNQRKVNRLFKLRNKEISFHIWVQYNLDCQLQQVVRYLHEQGVAIKGDLPIGISAHSVDAWTSPQLFNLDKQAGAPPDDFSVKGQNWGFPTYNWHAMERDDFLWWKNRFQYMARYFDAFRIDHILGFFRIWEIPTESTWGLLGYFSPALPFTVNEIEQYGFWFDRDRFTRPYLSLSHLRELFADQTDFVIQHFLTKDANDRYCFLPQYAAQRQLEDAAKTDPWLSDNPELADRMLSLYCEVIFIEDAYRRGTYHPRINVMASDSYANLDPITQRQIRQLHDEFFYRRNLMLWKNEAMHRLPILLHTNNMLVCGEDLGMVPDCVPYVMNELKILSLEIERMPKRLGETFVDKASIPYLSVSATGTHDTSTLRGWWGENREMTQRYYNTILYRTGQAPEAITSDLARQIVDGQIANNSMLSILPWQDYMACDSEYLDAYSAENDRINVPDNPRHIWSWRMPVFIEK